MKGQTPIELATIYQSLSTIEQIILRALSFFLAPTSRTSLTTFLKNLDVRTVASRQIQPQEVSALVTELIRKKVIIEDLKGVLCHPSMQASLFKVLMQEGEFRRFADAALTVIGNPQNYSGYSYYSSYRHLLQHLRLAVYLRDEKMALQILHAGSKYHSDDMQRLPPFASLLTEPLDADFLLSLPTNLLTEVLSELCNHSLSKMVNSHAFDILDTYVTARSDVTGGAFYLYLYFLFFRGRVLDVEAKLAQLEPLQYQDIRGILAFIKGDDDSAIACFDKEITRIKKQTGKRKIFLPGYTGLFHLLSLLRSGLPHHLETAAELSAIALKQVSYGNSSLWLLQQLAEFKSGISRNVKELVRQVNSEYSCEPLSQLIQSLASLWIKKSDVSVHSSKLAVLQKKAKSAGFAWIAAEAALLGNMIDPPGNISVTEAEKLYADQGIMPLAGSGGSGNEWERSLNALLSLGATVTSSGKTASATGTTRLVWFLFGNNNSISIQPMEQKQKGGSWSSGRNVALKRLADAKAETTYMTTQDHKISTCIKKQNGYYSQSYHDIDVKKALTAMIGHPLLFNEKTGELLTVARGEFTLKVDRKDKSLKLSISPLPPPNESVFFIWEGSSRLLVYEPSKEQQRIAAVIGDGLTVPLSGEEKIAATISAIAPFVTVHSDVVGEDATLTTVEPDNRVHIQLRPFGSGVVLELLTRPLGEEGPGFYPGKGSATVIAALKQKRVQTTRNLKLEKTLLQELMATCSTLDLYPSGDDFYRIDDPEGSLELLEELHEVIATNPDSFVIEWPEGERLKLRGVAAWDKMSVVVSSGKEWFSIEGDVALSETDVLSLQQLLELSDSHKGRFIPLAEGEFIALTEELRRKLDELSRMVDRHGKENRFHPLAASLVEDALHGAGGFKGDKLWKLTLERFKSATELEPQLPVTFQATLRDYQLEGFAWLVRLAHWGVGACLADDMGLGKTIQALALLVDRAPVGAALVLAPTSVCLNWESECGRFAPTLVPKVFGTGNRKEFIASVQPFDLVICSYTLFQQEAELLTGVSWHTLILDEAQAIKNMATKRSQAAMQLKADFRIATTGTPVENRLDELWNLFRFLNPGLLGSHKGFGERFGTPIERDGDKNARTLLKKLIRPFILRRTKNQVLSELPPRTDILQRVELSKEEMALYEALRRKAVETLQDSGGQKEGERQIRILAEIMRLRRACCNPRLVVPDCGFGSSKMTAFREIVDELRANGHRALVFSQFVDHLSLVRASLDADDVSYQYLDGSTPPKVRQEQVASFQRGEGELFLISLRAGGVGLNLTAADYVIHLDPWWNPAVEDQASDRAHRIGQLRPVTVYRLVAANTIEEKIVALHGQKRDLADSLLEGTDTAARVSAEDLLDLLREVR